MFLPKLSCFASLKSMDRFISSDLLLLSAAIQQLTVDLVTVLQYQSMKSYIQNCTQVKVSQASESN